MPAVVSRTGLYLALPMLVAAWAGGELAQRGVLLPLVAALWLGQLAADRGYRRASRWLLVPTGLAALAVFSTYLLAEAWLSVAALQFWLDQLPGYWPLFSARPPVLAVCVVFGLTLNVLLLSRLGLGSPMLLLLVALCLSWLTLRSLLPVPPFASSRVGVPLPIAAALWLLWLSQTFALLPVLRRYWQRILPPLTVGGLIALLAMISWHEQRESDNQRLYRLTVSDGDNIATMLASETAAHLKAMRRFTSFWNMLGHTPTRAEWEQQAKRYHDDFGYFRNIAYIDLHGTVIRVYPLRDNRSVLGLNLYQSDSAAQTALDRPLIYGIEGQTGIIDFLQGGRGVISYLPVRDTTDGTLRGAVGMVVSIDRLLNTLLAQSDNQNRAITLTGRDQVYFHYGPLGGLADWHYQKTVSIGTDETTLSVQPTLDWLLMQRERLPEVTLGFGLLLAYLLHMVLYVYRRLAQQHRLASQANDSLREEMGKREQLQREIEWLARHDELTQLPNRRQLLRWIDARQMQLPMALLICDIDHFKSVNDHFGHPAGDRYLKTLADRCRAPVEQAGGLFARYGGEEFVACLPTCRREQALAVAEALRTAVQASGLTLSDGSPVTLSIGVSVTESAPLERDRLFQAADDALYRAKQSGRNRVIEAVSV